MTKKKIVITGAAGNVGAKVRRHFETTGTYDLVLLDKRTDPKDASIIQVDLSEPAQTWSRYIAGADTIIHLAANPSPDAGWSELMGPNIDAVANLCLAARDNRVPRLILTSSVWAMAGKCNDRSISAQETPEPGTTPYAAAKMFAERLGRSVASDKMSVLVIRLGYVPHAGVALEAADSPWESESWISERDLVRGYECAVQAEFSSFQVINLVSDNPGMPWSLIEAERVIGFRPRDSRNVLSKRTTPSFGRFAFWKRAR